MYKVIIVDDEMLARVGIKSMIDWNQNGFVVVGEAENGKKALKLAEELLPDIIITDIKMPVLNGVELIKEIVQRKLGTKFIVLSAYDDFTYVKEAMKAGAEDYLIKLELQPERLLNILNSVKKTIELEKAENRNVKKADLSNERNLTILRDNFLKELLIGRVYSQYEMDEWNSFYNISLFKDQLICYVIQPDRFDIYDKYTDDDVHLLDYAMLNVVEEIVSDYQNGYAIQTSEREITVMISLEGSKNSSFRAELDGIEKAIKGALRTYLNLSVVLGSSDIHSGYPSLRVCYKEASMAVDRRFSFPPGSTIHYGDVKNYKVQLVELVDEMKELEHALQIVDIDQMKRIFLIMREKINASSQHSRENMKGFCSNLLYVVESAIANHQIVFPSNWKDNSNQKMNQLASLADFHTWFLEFEQVLLTILSETNETSKLIRSIKKYIVNNYHKEINLETIANEMNLSANYLSNLFKKETKENLIEFITKTRISQAIQLLKTTDKKIYEIGQLVGYDNEHYFSRVFKKVTGVSPNRYKA